MARRDRIGHRAAGLFGGEPCGAHRLKFAPGPTEPAGGSRIFDWARTGEEAFPQSNPVPLPSPSPPPATSDFGAVPGLGGFALQIGQKAGDTVQGIMGGDSPPPTGK